MEKCKIYFKNIDLLRFLFALFIIIPHLFSMFMQGNMPVNGDGEFSAAIPAFYQYIMDNSKFVNIIADFFFIISGFFLFFTINIEQNFYSFAKNKIVRLLPVIMFILILYYLCYFLGGGEVAKYENVWTVLFIQNIGITLDYGNLYQTWYVSVLFWTLSFYFYLYKVLNKSKLFNLITACIVLMSYSLFIHSVEIQQVIMNIGFVNKGILRGLGGVGLGYFIYCFYKDKLTDFKCDSIIIKTFITILEGFLLYFIIKTFICGMEYNNFLILIVAFVFLFILFLIKQGFISKILENNLSVFLGKFSYSIFIVNVFIIDLWKKYVYNSYNNYGILHPILNIMFLYIVIFIFAVIVYYLVEKPLVSQFSGGEEPAENCLPFQNATLKNLR